MIENKIRMIMWKDVLLFIICYLNDYLNVKFRLKKKELFVLKLLNFRLKI